MSTSACMIDYPKGDVFRVTLSDFESPSCCLKTVTLIPRGNIACITVFSCIYPAYAYNRQMSIPCTKSRFR